ncbi:MAG: MerR family transcriptional regulator [Acidimicrobiales bacterium]
MVDTSTATEMRVEALATRTGVGVDTIRYYQSQGLLEPPRRQGRTALYGAAHVTRLAHIRELADRGFTLAQIAELDRTGDGDPLLRSLHEQGVVDTALDSAELAQRTGLDQREIERIADLGLIGGELVAGHRCFPDAAEQVLRAIAQVVDAGVPTEQLGALALRHARHVEALVDDVIELVRLARGSGDRAALATDVDRLVPVVAAMVGTHFAATLVERSLRRLDPDDHDAAVR